VIVERSMHAQFLSNTYLVADEDGGAALFVDAGGPVAPLIDAAARHSVQPTHVLLTHHHFDHVCELGALRERWPEIEVLISPLERDLLAAASAPSDSSQSGNDSAPAIGTIEAGETLRFGALELRALHTPGHTSGMLSFLVQDGAEAAVFTGDTLFKNSVGGVRAPGHTTYADLRDAIMGTLMELRGDTVIYPGHSDSTTVSAEYETNRFIRVWRGLDSEGSEPCTALGEPATLVLLGDDYDGGTKAWIRWPDGSDDIVPGSRVERSA
jgi:glyoxylase-like metal-dependent hydrolase (beta-lactamase superfamily II)